MNITINEKEHTLTFGIAFLNYIDENSGMRVDIDGQEVNTGVAGMGMFKSKLSTYSPAALVTLIKAATVTERQKPSNVGIELWIEQLIGDEDEISDEYYNTYDEIVAEMGKSRVVKVASKGARH